MRVHFSSFVLDADARQLTRDGREVRLSPKAFDLLLILVQRRPGVVSKADLQARLWPKTFVSDTSLAMLVTELRAALGESGRRTRCIRTVHRHGYAFQETGRDVVVEPHAAASSLNYWVVTSSGETVLEPGENIVGRDPKARVRLDSPSVSRRHAIITVDVLSGDVTLEDLKSKNGTRARGARVTRVVPIVDGDQLRFGSVVVTFRASTVEPTRTDAAPS